MNLTTSTKQVSSSRAKQNSIFCWPLTGLSLESFLSTKENGYLVSEASQFRMCLALPQKSIKKWVKKVKILWQIFICQNLLCHKPESTPFCFCLLFLCPQACTTLCSRAVLRKYTSLFIRPEWKKQRKLPTLCYRSHKNPTLLRTM